MLDGGKDYKTSNYWKDNLERNIAAFKSQELEAKNIEGIESQEARNAIRERDWQYEVYGPNSDTPEIDDVDLEPERE